MLVRCFTTVHVYDAVVIGTDQAGLSAPYHVRGLGSTTCRWGGLERGGWAMPHFDSETAALACAIDRDVLVHGAYTAQRALEAGALDEIQIRQIPVLFGAWRRMFEVSPSRVESEIVRVIDTPEATHIRYRVRR